MKRQTDVIQTLLVLMLSVTISALAMVDFMEMVLTAKVNSVAIVGHFSFMFLQQMLMNV